jgi:hypothetical protein
MLELSIDINATKKFLWRSSISASDITQWQIVFTSAHIIECFVVGSNS